MSERLWSALQALCGPLNVSFSSVLIVPVSHLCQYWADQVSRFTTCLFFCNPVFVFCFFCLFLNFLKPVLFFSFFLYKTLVLEPTSHDQPSSVGLDHQLGQLLFKPFLPYVVWHLESDGKLDPHFCVVAALHHDQQNQGWCVYFGGFVFVCFLMGRAGYLSWMWRGHRMCEWVQQERY